MRYGIFGGTFDPMHAGHLSMITGSLASGLIDKVWVIPSGYPPQKDAHLMTLAPYRYFMVQSAVRDIPNCEVLSIEITRPQISYTVETIRVIREEHIAGPEDELFFIFGTDILFTLETWYHPEVLLKEAKCMIAQRPGDVTDKILQQVRFIENKYHIQIAFFPIKGVDISSSDIRSSRDDSKLLPAVRAFISKHNLYGTDNPLRYLKENTHRQLFEYGARLFKELSEKRMLHSMNVAMLSILYANRFGSDPDAAAIAGLLHDCAKELPMQEQRDLARQTQDEETPDDPLLHAPAGVIYAIEKYGITNKDILSAIHYHTTGREGMTVLEKIIFLADKLEPARNYDDLTGIRALADNDLDAATIACLQAVQTCMIKKDTVFHPEAARALDAMLLQMKNAAAFPQPASLKEEKMDTLSISKEIVSILTNKKAVDVEWIPVAEKTTLADYFIVASGTSTTHIKALSDEVEFVLKNECKIVPDHIEGLSTGRWVLLDYRDIVVHIFHPEERAHYSLEKLWLTKRPESESSSEEL